MRLHCRGVLCRSWWRCRRAGNRALIWRTASKPVLEPLEDFPHVPHPTRALSQDYQLFIWKYFIILWISCLRILLDWISLPIRSIRSTFPWVTAQGNSAVKCGNPPKLRKQDFPQIVFITWVRLVPCSTLALRSRPLFTASQSKQILMLGGDIVHRKQRPYFHTLRQD